MIYGAGIDIVEVFRMRDATKKWGENFLTKAFTKREIEYSSSKRASAQHFAGRFAAKEACAKAFGSPRKFPLNWTDIEVLNDKEGKPRLEFHGNALKLKKLNKINNAVLSIAHSKNYAVANVILVTKEK